MVSCVVVTYNTGKNIVETLNSIYNQSYDNIELIISDDGSKDDTVQVLNSWIADHYQRFRRTQVLTETQNTGTCKNLNRGIKASHGVWIKSIGDDLLTPSAIEDYLKYVAVHEDCQMCVSRMTLFGDCTHDVLKSYEKQWNYYFTKASESFDKQKKTINKELVFTGPTYFYSRALYDKVGGFDEDYILLEEWPFCKKVLSSGFRIHAIDKELVQYRVSENSVCHSRDKHDIPNPLLAQDLLKFFYSSSLKDLIANKEYLYAIDRYLWHKGLSLKLKYNNRLSYFADKILNLLSPYKYLKYLMRL